MSAALSFLRYCKVGHGHPRAMTLSCVSDCSNNYRPRLRPSEEGGSCGQGGGDVSSVEGTGKSEMRRPSVGHRPDVLTFPLSEMASQCSARADGGPVLR